MARKIATAADSAAALKVLATPAAKAPAKAPVKVAAKTLAKKPAAKKDVLTTCRSEKGYSKCGGKNPSISAKWHLCQPCTVIFRAAKRAAAKAAPTKPAKVVALPTRKPAPAPARVAHPRVSGLVAVEPTITKVEQAAERRGDRGN
jgi:hypothetical protein